MSAIPAGYKQTELGEIPEDWICTSVGKLVQSGALEKPLDGNHGNIHPKSGDFVDFGIPFVMANNVQGGQLDLNDCSFIRKEQADSLQKGFSLPGDVLLTHKATIGNTAVVGDIPFPYVMLTPQVTYYRVIDKKRLNNIYLRHFFDSHSFQRTLQVMSGGGTRSYIGITAQLQLPVATPPSVAEQEAIAETLTDADTLIESLEQLLTKKRHLKQAAMQELLTGKKRLPGFSGAWSMTRLGDVADPNQKWSFTGGPFGSNLKSTDYTDGGVRIIQLQNIGDGQFHNDYSVFTSREKANELLSCNIYPGEIILSKMGDPVARACLIPSFHDRYLMCSDGIRLAVDPKRFNTYFVYLSINAPNFRVRAENAGTGSTRKRIGLTELRNLELSCPDLFEQTAIADILSEMDAEIADLEAQLAKTRTIKQGMMQKLLTGEIRLI